MCCSMRSSPSSDLGGDASSPEPPLSPFGQAGGNGAHSRGGSGILEERLQALLGPVTSGGPPVPQSGFSSALMKPRSDSDISRQALQLKKYILSVIVLHKLMDMFPFASHLLAHYSAND